MKNFFHLTILAYLIGPIEGVDRLLCWAYLLFKSTKSLGWWKTSLSIEKIHGQIYRLHKFSPDLTAGFQGYRRSFGKSSHRLISSFCLNNLEDLFIYFLPRRRLILIRDQGKKTITVVKEMIEIFKYSRNDCSSYKFLQFVSL